MPACDPADPLVYLLDTDFLKANSAAQGADRRLNWSRKQLLTVDSIDDWRCYRIAQLIATNRNTLSKEATEPIGSKSLSLRLAPQTRRSPKGARATDAAAKAFLAYTSYIKLPTPEIVLVSSGLIMLKL